MQEIRKQYEFRVLGKVKAKQSVKFAKIGDFMRKYTPKDMVDYANWVKTCFMQTYPDAKPEDLDGFQLSVSLYVYFATPKSFSKKKLELVKQGILRPTVKPDWDNISKNICDALNGIAYPDDKAIVSGSVHKYYGSADYVNIVITGQKCE